MEMRRFFLALVLLTFLAGTQFVIFYIDREPWFDVSFSLQTAYMMRTNGPTSIDFTKHDVHPPVFYWALYGWSLLNPGMTEYHWAQEMSVFFGLLFFLIAFVVLDKMFGKKAWFALLLMTACTAYLHYFTEVRMYSILLFLSAFFLLCVQKKLDRWWGVAGALTIAVFPFVHYYSGAVAIAFFSLFTLVMLKRWSPRDWKRKGISIILVGAIALACAFFFMAMPQKSRVMGTWFQPPTLDQAPSAMMYAFFMAEGFPSNWVFFTTYILMGMVMMLFAWKAYAWLSEPLDDERIFMLMMGLGAVFPLAGLAAAPLLGGDGFAHLYHHRFFLVVTWMFAALVLMKLFDLAASKRFWVKIAGLLGVLLAIVSIGMVLTDYTIFSHHELEEMMLATPCKSAEPIQIAHESPFSALPFEVWARQYGCNWFNFASMNMTPRMMNGGGGDAMPPGTMFFNSSLPSRGNYFIIYAAGTVPVDGEMTEVEIGDGVHLHYVMRGEYHDPDNWTMEWWYDNRTEYQYTRVRWVSRNGGPLTREVSPNVAQP